jgi:TRAP-type C4-dicarboxylate transport system substrate-binding protein
MNASWWSSLSDFEQNVIQAAAAEEHARAHDETMARNGEYLVKLVEEQGVEVRNFNDDVWDAMGEGAKEVFEETRDHSALATEVDDAYQKGMREIGGMIAQFELTAMNQRNRVFDIG